MRGSTSPLFTGQITGSYKKVDQRTPMGRMQHAAPQRFQVGDHIEVRIESDHPALKGLHASTEVVWIADQPGGQQKFGLRVLAMH